MRNKPYYILLLLCLPLGIFAQQIDSSSATITFEFVSKNVKGSISGFESKSKIDWDQFINSSFKGSVAVKTLDTNNGLRNWHLKGGKYFDEDDFPSITFESTAITQNDLTYHVKGNLTIKGITKQVGINFAKKGNQLKGKMEIYSSDYGIKIKKKREDNLVKITLLFDLK